MPNYQDDPGWDRIADAIDAKFGITKHGKRTEPLEDNTELEQQVSFIQFEKDGEEFMMERIASPAILDRKTHYHKAAGSGVRYENVYDPEAVSFKTRLLKRDGDEWEEISPDQLAL
ncbi:MAG TPA: hypothetical protein VLF41_01645 [Candidatus Nanoarchaeia archaeon]|nr:hypothetical protein [Candidatus Nanoarchaeia archaeon]